jgi:hypothetical protein
MYKNSAFDLDTDILSSIILSIPGCQCSTGFQSEDFLSYPDQCQYIEKNPVEIYDAYANLPLTY